MIILDVMPPQVHKDLYNYYTGYYSSFSKTSSTYCLLKALTKTMLGDKNQVEIQKDNTML